MDKKIAFWFSGFEKGIEVLTQQQRETFFMNAARTVSNRGHWIFTVRSMRVHLATWMLFSSR